jgi:aminoglycoside phosphotransferase (APT) family kinase protein
MANKAELPGIVVENLSPWLEENLEDFKGPFEFSLITGGRSNLTYKIISSGGRSVILRRPPVAEVLKTAHDMKREFRIISALGPTSVPVPRALKYADDPDIIGASFYLMSFVDGHIIRDAEYARQALPNIELRKNASRSLVNVLADLHALDYKALRLEDFGKEEGYVKRQLNRWWGQFEQSIEPGDSGISLIKDLYAELISNVPVQQKTSIVHGDYRLDNTVIGDDGLLKAVLDWEICTIGDPLADLGLLMVYWVEPGQNNPLLALAATSLEGFYSKDQIKALYTEKSDLDISNLNYYVAFGYWKLACILQGVFNRYRKGAGAGDTLDLSGLSKQVEILGKEAESFINA